MDFHNLNKACLKDEFPLPNINVLVDSAVRNSILSIIDGYSGYNQIRMAAKDATKITFETLIVNFYYTVMPISLKISRATYQCTMTTIFHDMIYKEMKDYVDDIAVKSKTRARHFQVFE